MAIRKAKDWLRLASPTLLFLVVLCTIFFVMARYWPPGPDYYFTFRPVTKSFFSGETQLYDSNSTGYFNAPWGILLIAPTLLLPPNYGQAVMTITTLVGLLFSIHAINSIQGERRISILALVLAITNLHTFDLLIRGNIDGFILIGLALGWISVKQRKPFLLGIGLWLLSVKPPNIILAAIVMIWYTREWSRKDKLISIAPVCLTFLLSLYFFAPDWPIRYLRFIVLNPQLNYLQTSLWRAFDFFGLNLQISFWITLAAFVTFILIIVWSNSAQGNRLLSLAITTNLAFSAYSLGSHFVLLAPVYVLITSHNRWFLASWLLTLTPLLRLVWGFEVAWIDLAYPFTLMIGILLLMLQEPVRTP